MLRVYSSPFGDINLPQLDILSLLFNSGWCLAAEQTKIHVDAGNPRNCITKHEARKLTQKLAYIFRNRFGIGKYGAGKDHVLTMTCGSPFAPVLFYGIVAAGGVFCGANTESRPSELVHQIKDASTTLLLCSVECKGAMIEAANQCHVPLDRVLIVDPAKPGAWTLSSVVDEVDILGQSPGLLEWDRITERHTLESTTTCLLYSSGTTGLPKGVRISQQALIANNVCTMAVARRYKARCEREGRSFVFSTIAHLPMANIAGITLYATNPFYMGGTTWWMKSYEFNSFLNYHRQYRPSYQFSVPPIWLRIAKSDQVSDQLDHLQVAVTGSAPIGYETVAELKSRLGKGMAHMSQTWGATEAAGVITALDWPEHSENGTWSVGQLCPNVKLRVVNDEGHDVEEGELGEMWISGPILAQGYHNRPEADREAFVDGYYRTGDIGTIRNGFVQIVDRKKEMIKYKGSQVAPAELEAVLTSHQDIDDAAVIGVWDDSQQTEVPQAYIVRRPSTAVSFDEVQTFVSSKVARYKQLRGGVQFLDVIPKSASGKILRKELRMKAQQGAKAKL